MLHGHRDGRGGEKRRGVAADAENVAQAVGHVPQRVDPVILLRFCVVFMLLTGVLCVAWISRCRVVCAADHDFLAEWSAQA